MAAPLHALLPKDQEWRWTGDWDAAVETAKEWLTSQAVLGLPDSVWLWCGQFESTDRACTDEGSEWTQTIGLCSGCCR